MMVYMLTRERCAVDPVECQTGLLQLLHIRLLRLYIALLLHTSSFVRSKGDHTHQAILCMYVYKITKIVRAL